MAQPGATSIGWKPLTQPHARPEKSLEFCEILYATGRRSPENCSQGLRPPWGVHASPRRSGAAGQGGSPSGIRVPGGGAHPGRAAAACGRPRAQNGRDRGQRRAHSGKKLGCRGQKRAGLPGNGAQRARFGRQLGAQCRVETGKTGWPRRGNGGFRRGFAGKTAGRRGENGGVSGLWAAKRGEKSPHVAGFGRKTGRNTAYSGRRVTGSLFFRSRAPNAPPFAPI